MKHRLLKAVFKRTRTNDFLKAIIVYFQHGDDQAVGLSFKKLINRIGLMNHLQNAGKNFLLIKFNQMRNFAPMTNQQGYIQQYFQLLIVV